MEIAQKAHPIILTLLKIQRKYKKDYSFPSQITLLKLLKDRQGIQKSIATLNRWLRVAEDSKYLMRRRRIRYDPVYGNIFKSTLYKVTIKGYWLLSRLGVDVKNEIDDYEAWREQIKRRDEQAASPVRRGGGLTALRKIGIIQKLLEPQG